MEGAGPVLLVVAILVVVGLCAWWAWKAEQERRRRLLEWAQRRGLRIAPDRVSGWTAPFDLFQQGHSRWRRYVAQTEVSDAVPGLGEARVEVFEYHYAVTTHNGKHSQTHHYHHTCAVATAPVDLSDLVVRPEGFGDKIAQAVGFDDIDFEDGEFSRSFVVKGRDRRAVHALIDARMMRMMLLRGRPWSLLAGGRRFLVHRAGRPSPEAFDDLLGYVASFLGQVPRIVVNEERARQGLPPLLEAGAAARP